MNLTLLENFRNVDRSDEGSRGSKIDSTVSNNEEDENPWEVNQLKKDHRFRPGRYNSSQNLGVKVDIPDLKRRKLKDFEEFIDEFDRLSLRCDVVEEEEIIALYLADLKPEITRVVCL
ncbi:hypothetical protein Tco_0162384 [Tanacetum coccineum]